jgi:micrococcal nuclease
VTFAWVFPARLERLIDGDTLVLECDVGMHGRRVERMRLLHVDAPEVRGESKPAGLAATAYAAAWLAEAGAGEWPLTVTTVKDPDSFGRYLCWCRRTSDGRELNADLVAAGHGVVA